MEAFLNPFPHILPPWPVVSTRLSLAFLIPLLIFYFLTGLNSLWELSSLTRD